MVLGQRNAERGGGIGSAQKERRKNSCNDNHDSGIRLVRNKPPTKTWFGCCQVERAILGRMNISSWVKVRISSPKRCNDNGWPRCRPRCTVLPHCVKGVADCEKITRGGTGNKNKRRNASRSANDELFGWKRAAGQRDDSKMALIRRQNPVEQAVA